MSLGSWASRGRVHSVPSPRNMLLVRLSLARPFGILIV
jgi:hypothetical protein